MIIREKHAPALEGWSEDAQKTMIENPKYFVWWYSAKSIALVAALAALTYQLGKSAGRKVRK